MQVISNYVYIIYLKGSTSETKTCNSGVKIVISKPGKMKAIFVSLKFTVKNDLGKIMEDS